MANRIFPVWQKYAFRWIKSSVTDIKHGFEYREKCISLLTCFGPSLHSKCTFMWNQTGAYTLITHVTNVVRFSDGEVVATIWKICFLLSATSNAQWDPALKCKVWSTISSRHCLAHVLKILLVITGVGTIQTGTVSKESYCLKCSYWQFLTDEQSFAYWATKSSRPACSTVKFLQILSQREFICMQ